MNQLAQTSQYSVAAYNKYKVENAFVQLVVFLFLAASALISLGAAIYCIHRGGSVTWSYHFGVFVELACKFTR